MPIITIEAMPIITKETAPVITVSQEVPEAFGRENSSRYSAWRTM